ncbi:MAG TPA: hypothetical protein VFF06_06335 [Polyangia bacterium]|nr:hypothetical protein [Polyangia bacterium]
MKKALIIAGSIVGAIAVLVALVFVLTGGVVDATDQLVALCAGGKTHEAYLSAASGLRAQQDEAAFAAAVARLKLTERRSSSWSSRRIENNRGFVDGTITTRAGEVVPLSVTLVKEQGAWRVLSLAAAPAGADSAGATPPPPAHRPPPDEESRRLVTSTLTIFDRAIAGGDFAPLLAQSCEPMRKQFTAVDLKQHFQEFLDKRVRVSEVERVPPIFTLPPIVDDDGLLVLEGFYPSDPPRTWFKLRFLSEAGAWKLAAIKVNKDAGAPYDDKPPLPNGVELERVTRRTMIDFIHAAQAKDFEPFHAGLSALWRPQITAAELQKDFAAFGKAPRSTVDDLAALPLVVDAAPKLTGPGVLELVGHFDCKPPLHFGLKYVYEHPTWKLFGIKASM